VIERVVFDTSALIGAALKVGSKPHRALSLALEFCVLCGSDQIIAELAEVLHRSYFERYLSQMDRDNFLTLIRNNLEMYSAEVIAQSSIDPPCRDPNDHFILALALAAKANAIVSSDHDLLIMNPWNGIQILTPAEFLAQVES
jgi:uncharacterized protein